MNYNKYDRLRSIYDIIEAIIPESIKEIIASIMGWHSLLLNQPGMRPYYLSVECENGMRAFKYRKWQSHTKFNPGGVNTHKKGLLYFQWCIHILSNEHTSQFEEGRI